MLSDLPTPPLCARRYRAICKAKPRHHSDSRNVVDIARALLMECTDLEIYVFFVRTYMLYFFEIGTLKATPLNEPA